MTTAERWRQIAGRVSAALLPWNLEISVREIDFNIHVSLMACVPDRDTMLPSGVTFDYTFADYHVAESSDEAVIDLLYSMFRVFVLHELDEAFTLDGVRIKDPHANGRTETTHYMAVSLLKGHEAQR
jgi:hypothetical protein